MINVTAPLSTPIRPLLLIPQTVWSFVTVSLKIAHTFPLVENDEAVIDSCLGAGTQGTYYGVWTNTPDTHALFYYGTCVFEAGTRNLYYTWIGSSNIRDIMTLAMDKWQVGLYLS